MRNLAIVLNQICSKITEDSEPNLLSLKEELNLLQKRLLYRAPEDMVGEWNLANKWINIFINKDYTDLSKTEKEIVDIWMNKI